MRIIEFCTCPKHAATRNTENRYRLIRLMFRKRCPVLQTHLDKTANQTFYQFGYLFFADSLCYWDRELTQVGGILGSTSAIPLSCFF